MHVVVFVEIESDDISEAEPLLTMQANQFVVGRDGCTTRGQSEYARLARLGALASQLGNLPGNMDAGIPRVLDDMAHDSFPLGKRVELPFEAAGVGVVVLALHYFIF
jgi:hypothetical protein